MNSKTLLTTPPISIRQMEPDDFPRVQEILAQFFPKIQDEKPTPFDFFFSDASETYSVVALSEQVVLGTATLKVGKANDVYLEAPEYTFSDAQVRYVAKDPQCLIKGIGRGLVGELLSYASCRTEIKSCALLVKPRNDQAIHIYESLGFQRTKSIVVEQRTGIQLMCMTKQM